MRTTAAIVLAGLAAAATAGVQANSVQIDSFVGIGTTIGLGADATEVSQSVMGGTGLIGSGALNASFSDSAQFDFGDDGGGPIGLQTIVSGDVSQNATGGFQPDGFRLGLNGRGVVFADGFATGSGASAIEFTMNFDVSSASAYSARLDVPFPSVASSPDVDFEVVATLEQTSTGQVFDIGDTDFFVNGPGDPLESDGTLDAGSYTLTFAITGFTANDLDFFTGGYSYDYDFDFFVAPTPGAAAPLALAGLAAARRRR